MIYIIVNTSGEYSDYQMKNLYASTSKDRAETKVKELKDLQDRSLKVYQEIYPITTNYYHKSWKPNLDHNQWLVFLKNVKDFENKILIATLPKYNITKEEYENRLYGNIFIEELEEI